MTTATRKYRTTEELYKTVEDLHPDLKEYIDKTSKMGWPCLKHPLVFGVPYMEQMNAVYNEQYKCKKDHLEEIEQKGEGWGTYVWLHERPYRFQVFMDIQNKISDKEYWELLGAIWTDTENQWQVKDYLSFLLNNPRPGREFLMDEDEKMLYESLPSEVNIYRGHQRHNKLGFSWTLSVWRARWFAQRFYKNGIVSKVAVKKEDITAVFMGRGEMEVAIHPKKLAGIETVRKLRRTPFLEAVLAQATEEFRLGPRSMHGPWHWDQVERNAIMLAEQTPGADAFVCRLFSMLHDCKRLDEHDDPEHGHRAAEYILSVKDGFGLKQDQLDKLTEACRFHNDGQTSTDPTIGVCWDADRLDLPRVGITPDPQLLSTEAAKGLIWRV